MGLGQVPQFQGLQQGVLFSVIVPSGTIDPLVDDFVALSGRQRMYQLSRHTRHHEMHQLVASAPVPVRLKVGRIVGGDDGCDCGGCGGSPNWRWGCGG